MGRLRHYAGLVHRTIRPKPLLTDPGEPWWAVHPAKQFPQYRIGRHTYGRIQVFPANDDVGLTIGDYCSLAEETAFWLGGEHRPDWVTTYPFNAIDPKFGYIKGHPAARGDIVIGSDVWTGWRSTIMSGVTVGHGAVVATGALVVEDVAPYTIVGGVPAKVIRKRFDDETIARLLEIAWWSWDEASIEAAVPLLQSDAVSTFIAEVDAGRLPLTGAAQ